MDLDDVYITKKVSDYMQLKINRDLCLCNKWFGSVECFFSDNCGICARDLQEATL